MVQQNSWAVHRTTGCDGMSTKAPWR